MPATIQPVIVTPTLPLLLAFYKALLGAVTGEQRSVLNPGFDDFDLQSPRRLWTYLPELDRPGLPLRDMPDAQRKLAHKLIIRSNARRDAYRDAIFILIEDDDMKPIRKILHRLVDRGS